MTSNIGHAIEFIAVEIGEERSRSERLISFKIDLLTKIQGLLECYEREYEK